MPLAEEEEEEEEEAEPEMEENATRTLNSPSSLFAFKRLQKRRISRANLASSFPLKKSSGISNVQSS